MSNLKQNLEPQIDETRQYWVFKETDYDDTNLNSLEENKVLFSLKEADDLEFDLM